MPIRTYLLLIVLISTLGGVGLSSLQLQRNTARLEAEAEIRQAETFVSSLRPLRDSLRGFFSSFDLYIGSGQFFMEGGIKEGLSLYTEFFRDLERMAPTDEQKEAVRVLARGMTGFEKYVKAVQEHGQELPNEVLNGFDRDSQKPVDAYAHLQKLAADHLATTLTDVSKVQEDSRTASVIALLAFVLVAIGLLRWASRSIASPIARLTLSAETAVEHGGHFQSTNAGANEVQSLSESIGHLTNKLEALVLRRTDELHRKNHELNEEIACRAETENRLRLAKTAAETASAAKSDFLAVMSHELRTPLHSILGFSDVLVEGIQGELNAEQKRSVNNISTSGKHLLSLINDILDLSKIEAGKESLNLEGVDVEMLCEEVVTLLSRQAGKKSIKIQKSIAKDVGKVTADRRRIRQILFNLLSNAVKFTPEGGAIGLTVDLGRKSDHRANAKASELVEFVVWDEGIGISEENQEKLFEPFVQVDSRLARSYEGTGLGLSLVKRLTKMHGGRVVVESEEKKGSRFIVQLPWSRAESAGNISDVALDESAALFLQRNSNQRPLVLLVEDNELNQQLVVAYLESEKFEVLVAEEGATALRLVEAQQFDLILTDIQMPGMDGLELTRELRKRERTRDVPVVALTAQAMAGDREECLRAGANEYLTKPLDLKQLVAVANRFFGRHGEKTVDEAAGPNSRW